MELEVYMTNDSQPIITITNLAEDELEIKVDDVFMVEVDVADPTTREYASVMSIVKSRIKTL